MVNLYDSGFHVFILGISSSITNLSCLQFLVNQMTNLTGKTLDVSDLGIIDPNSNGQNQSYQISYTDKFFGFHPFYIARGEFLHSFHSD